ncbi:LPXTG cell wall anchor domain-containing protein [Vibrio cholerae]|nr:LPXTG cell wall anchor domain-containing protein [Vibrio cholerae]
MAQTGANVLLIAGAGVVLALLGGALLLFRRRQHAGDIES